MRTKSALIKLIGVGLTALSLWGQSAGKVSAQMGLIEDSSLGSESTVVTPADAQTFHIENGATRSNNIFHSFEEFNINDGEAAYFLIDDASIENIFSRITGNDASDILGTLGTCFTGACGSGAKPDATLYLMNPNGIVFGEDARLDVGGSFVATTANGIQFGSQGAFNSNLAEDSSLLAINPSAFLFSQIGAGAITNSSRSDAGTTPSGRTGIFGLRVPNGETLLLLGGDVTADNGGGLVVFDGQLEIGSVAGIGSVGLNIEGNSLNLSFPDTLERSNITLDNRAGFLATTATTGRNVQFYAQDINILNGSGIFVGIESGIPNSDAQSGNLNLNALGNILISGSSIIQSNVPRNSSGNSGSITINAHSLIVNTSSLLSARVLGAGNAGAISITASDKVVIDGPNLDEDGIPTGNRTIVSASFQGRSGESGGISIVTNTLEITNRAQLLSFVGGEGNSGDININATGKVLLRNGVIISEVNEGQGRGDAGDININAQSLTLRNGAAILSDTEYFGDAGHITVSINDAVTLEGRGPSALDFRNNVPSQISSTVEILGVGGGGNIAIDSGSLQMTDDAFITASTQGRGAAGAIEIDVNSLTMSEGAHITADSFAGGRAGAITVTVRDRFSIDGNESRLSSETENPRLAFESGDDAGASIEASQSLDSTGNNESFYQIVGNLSDENDVDIYRIRLEEDSLLSASTTNNITERLRTNTRLVLFDADGKGLYFNDDQRDGVIQSAIDGVELDAGEYYLAVTNHENEPRSESGNIFDEPSSFTELLEPNNLGGAAPLQSWTEEGRGRGPYVIDITGINGPIIPGLDAGNITIEAGELLLTNSAAIKTETFGSGNGGVIDIDAGVVTIESSNISSSTNGIGSGGEIVIAGDELMVSDRSTISARSSVERTTIPNASANANAGDITIAITDSFRLTNSDISTESEDFAGGEIRIIARDMQLHEDGDITTRVQKGQEGGGDITLTADSIIAFDDSDIISSAPEGEGGNITLNTPAFFGEDLQLNVPGETDGNARVDVNATGVVNGVVTAPDVRFIQNSLTELPDGLVGPDSLVANSCIAQSQEADSVFEIIGSSPVENLNQTTSTPFLTGEVSAIADSTSETANQAYPGEVILEPEAIHQLADGRLVMVRNCQ